MHQSCSKIAEMFINIDLCKSFDCYFMLFKVFFPPTLSKLYLALKLLFGSQCNRTFFIFQSLVHFSPQNFRQKIAVNFLNRKNPFRQYVLRFYCLFYQYVLELLKTSNSINFVVVHEPSSKTAWDTITKSFYESETTNKAY